MSRANIIEKCRYSCLSSVYHGQSIAIGASHKVRMMRLAPAKYSTSEHERAEGALHKPGSHLDLLEVLDAADTSPLTKNVYKYVSSSFHRLLSVFHRSQQFFRKSTSPAAQQSSNDNDALEPTILHAARSNF